MQQHISLPASLAGLTLEPLRVDPMSCGVLGTAPSWSGEGTNPRMRGFAERCMHRSGGQRHMWRCPAGTCAGRCTRACTPALGYLERGTDPRLITAWRPLTREGSVPNISVPNVFPGDA